jgi:hypothetical protein
MANTIATKPAPPGIQAGKVVATRDVSANFGERDFYHVWYVQQVTTSLVSEQRV